MAIEIRIQPRNHGKIHQEESWTSTNGATDGSEGIFDLWSIPWGISGQKPVQLCILGVDHVDPYPLVNIQKTMENHHF